VDALRAEPTPRWAELALRLGYYDQAHLVREVRAFSDLAPTALLRERMSDSSNTARDDRSNVRSRRRDDRERNVEPLEG
jgi:hypothetical protein